MVVIQASDPIHTAEQIEGLHENQSIANQLRQFADLLAEQNATHDWVAVFRDDANAHGRWTVITSQLGKLKGSRIVRGREEACQEYDRKRNTFHRNEAGHQPHTELPTKWKEDEGRRGVHG